MGTPQPDGVDEESLAAGQQGSPAYERKWDRILESATKHQRLEQGRWDKFLELYKEGQFRKGAFGREPGEGSLQGEDGESCSANLTYQHVTILLAVLMAESPQHEVEPHGAAVDLSFQQLGPYVGAAPEDLQRVFADACEEALRETYKTGRMRAHDEAALGEALIRGQAWTKVSWDVEAGTDRIDTLRRDEVFIDPHARYDVSQARYLVHTCLLPVDEARTFFGRFGVGPEQILPNFTAAGEEQGLALRTLLEGQPTNAGGERDLFKFHECWAVEDGRLRVKYRKWQRKGADWLVPDADPPFQTARQRMPFAQLAFARQWLRLSDAFPELYVVDGLRHVHEELWDYVQKHARRNLAVKYLYDEGLIDKDTLERMLNSKDTEFIPVRLDGKTINDYLHELKLGRDMQPDIELMEFARATHDRLVGIDEILQGGARTQDMTAKEASIRDAWGKLRIGRMIGKLDEWQEEIAQLRLCALRTYLDPQQAQRIASHPLAGLLWQSYQGSPEELLGEFSVGTETGSTGRTHKAEKLEKLQQAFALGKDVNAQYGAPVVDLIQLWLRMMELQDVRRPSRFLNPQMAAMVSGGMVPPNPAAGPAGAPTPAGSPAGGPAEPAQPAGP
ncbi:MAG: hypothetical protein M5U26_03585 [Planctomycetota bacterium]|nr:hypothetical protein [Planctomycetota bacterium]